jgi:hypothetical protein
MADDARPPNELGNVLVSLQKSFSRVSRDSAGVPAHQARALVVGKVAFEMSFKCETSDGALLVTDSGGIALRLTGTIDVDIRTPSGGHHQPPWRNRVAMNRRPLARISRRRCRRLCPQSRSSIRWKHERPGHHC